MLTLKETILSGIKESNGINNYIKESTEIIFKNKDENKYRGLITKKINMQNINFSIGRFFLVKYYSMWLPIFTITNEDNLLYVIILNYLPYKLKIEIFNRIWLTNKDVIKNNINKTSADKEVSLHKTDFKILYQLIKEFDLGFSVRPLDVSKIKHSILISTDLMNRILFFDPKVINFKILETILLNEDSPEKKRTLEKIISDYIEILKGYEEDSVEFYKKLKLFEKYYKIIDQISNGKS
jgi:hypothetical protein